MRGLVFLLVVGCGASAPPEPHSEPLTSPVVVTPADADAAALGLSASVDLAQGLVVVARIEDASDGEAPPMIGSGHLCSGQEIAAVAAVLSDYVSQRRSMGEGVVWSCRAERCELRGMMEYDPTRVLRFGRSARGDLVVIGVDFFEDVGSGPEFVAEVRAQVDRDHAALRGPCP